MPFGICHHKTICRRDKTCFFCNLRIDYTVCLTDSRDFIRKLRRRISYQQDVLGSGRNLECRTGGSCRLSGTAQSGFIICQLDIGRNYRVRIFCKEDGSDRLYFRFRFGSIFKIRIVQSTRNRCRWSDHLQCHPGFACRSRYRCFHSSRCRHYCTQTISLPPMQTYQNTSFSFFYN